MNILTRFRQLELFAASFRKNVGEAKAGAKHGESDGATGAKQTPAKRKSGRETAKRRTVRLAISAFCAALSVTAMFFGVAFGVLDLSALVASSFLVVFCLIEMGGSYPYLVWLATSTLAFFLVPDKLVFFEYFIFAGAYPILKFRIARLPTAAGWAVKLASFNAALTACAALSTWVLGLDAEAGIAFGWAAYLAGNAMFLIYDLALSSVSAFYILRLRRVVGADRI